MLDCITKDISVIELVTNYGALIWCSIYTDLGLQRQC